jgi:hypothetical protein
MRAPGDGWRYQAVTRKCPRAGPPECNRDISTEILVYPAILFVS